MTRAPMTAGPGTAPSPRCARAFRTARFPKSASLLLQQYLFADVEHGNRSGDPNNWTLTPGWNQYAGEGYRGIAVAALTGATGWGAVVTVVAVPIADAWQNEPALHSDVNWLGNTLLCAAIEGLDSYLSDASALTNLTSLYNQAGCAGY